ncbi:MAG: hypothetical protein QNJ97_25450 [Myxococcota bacterium]|nr:hypothetical protein [Myxococcota bacterium]
MGSSTTALKRAYRNAWILLALVSAAVVIFFAFTLKTNRTPPPPSWDMGNVPFVPASSTYANGYYSPVDDAPKKEE